MHNVELRHGPAVIGRAHFSVLAPRPHPASPSRTTVVHVNLYSYPASLSPTLDPTSPADVMRLLTPVLTVLGTLTPEDFPPHVQR